MAIRYDADFKNTISEEVVWRVEMIDDLSTPIGDFECSGNRGVVIVWEGPSSDPKPGLYPTRCEVNFLIENAQYEFYIDDLIEHPRDRFGMKVYRNGEFWWCGRFSTENIQFSDQSYPSVSRITAIDGLGHLKEIDFAEDDGTKYEFNQPFMTIIANIFGKLDIQELHDNDIFLSVTCDWYNEQMKNKTDNPLELAGIYQDKWLDDGDFVDCYTVLNDICVGWNMYMVHSEGYFQMYQLRSVALGEYRRFYYNKTFDLLSVGNVNQKKLISTDYSNSTGPYGGGNLWSIMPGLKRYISYCKIEGGNAFGAGQTRFNEENTAEIELGPVTAETDMLTRLRVRLRSKTELVGTFADPFDVSPHRYRWDIRLKFVDQTATEPAVWASHIQYMDGTAGGSFYKPEYETDRFQFSNSATYVGKASEVWWADVDPNLNVIIDRLEDIVEYDNTSNATSLLVDGVTYDVFLQVQLIDIVDEVLNDISSDPDYSFFWETRGYSVEFLKEDGNPVSGTQVVEAKGGFVNSEDFDARIEQEIQFCDAENDISGILINYTGTNWQYSTKEWYHRLEQSKFNRSFLRLRSRDNMVLRTKNRRVYQGTFIDHEAHFTKIYEYQGRFYWAMGRVSMSTSEDLITGRFFELYEEEDENGIDEDADVIASDAGPTGLDDIDPPAGPPVQRKPIELGQYLPASLSSVVQFDIFNLSTTRVPSGTVLMVTNKDGKYRFFQIAEALTGTTTQNVSINPKTFDLTFSVLDEIRDAYNWLEHTLEIFFVDATDVANNYLTVTKIPELIDPQYCDTDEDYDSLQYTEVWRAGGNSRLAYSSDLQINMNQRNFGIDVSGSNNRVTFPTNYPLLPNEVVLVRGRYARFL